MSKRDFYHDTVRHALEADGWTITHDPLSLKFGDRNAFVDLGAEGPLAAERAGHKIAVGVKSFLGSSDITDMERTLEQFVFYEFLLADQEPERDLFLAIPDRAYESLLDTLAGQKLIQMRRLRLFVINDRERIAKWIEPDTLP